MDDIGYVKSKKNLYNTNTELGLKKERASKGVNVMATKMKDFNCYENFSRYQVKNKKENNCQDKEKCNQKHNGIEKKLSEKCLNPYMGLDKSNFKTKSEKENATQNADYNADYINAMNNYNSGNSLNQNIMGFTKGILNCASMFMNGITNNNTGTGSSTTNNTDTTTPTSTNNDSDTKKSMTSFTYRGPFGTFTMRTKNNCGTGNNTDTTSSPTTGTTSSPTIGTTSSPTTGTTSTPTTDTTSTPTTGTTNTTNSGSNVNPLFAILQVILKCVETVMSKANGG